MKAKSVNVTFAFFDWAIGIKKEDQVCSTVTDRSWQVSWGWSVAWLRAWIGQLLQIDRFQVATQWPWSTYRRTIGKWQQSHGADLCTIHSHAQFCNDAQQEKLLLTEENGCPQTFHMNWMVRVIIVKNVVNMPMEMQVFKERAPVDFEPLD